MAGVDLLTVKEILGHRDINTTLRYSHLAPDHLHNAINQIGTDTKTDTGENEEVNNEIKGSSGLIDNIKESIGWGTRIRTLIDRSRACRPAIRRSPTHLTAKTLQ